MTWYVWMSLAACILCLLLLVCRFLGLLRLGAPKDLSEPAGSITRGVIYSSTTAMLPQNKESAYLHLPTYIGGIFYHIGIFLSLLAFVWFWIAGYFNLQLPVIINQIIAGLLMVSALCGLSILLKRIFSPESRVLSTPDDYLSNALATAMVAVSGLVFLGFSIPVIYHLIMTAMFLWLPFGKTKHVLYFFFARYHLGYFYGRRGTWPIPKM